MYTSFIYVMYAAEQQNRYQTSKSYTYSLK